MHLVNKCLNHFNREVVFAENPVYGVDVFLMKKLIASGHDPSNERLSRVENHMSRRLRIEIQEPV